MSTRVAWQVNHKSLEQSTSTKPRWQWPCRSMFALPVHMPTGSQMCCHRNQGLDFHNSRTGEVLRLRLYRLTLHFWRRDRSLWTTSADTQYILRVVCCWILRRFCLPYTVKTFHCILLWGATQVRMSRCRIHPRSLETDQIQPVQRRETTAMTSMKSHKHSKMMLRQMIADNILYYSITFNGKIWMSL